MFEYRITKYDPQFRDTRGAYTRDEWTAVSDVGQFFDGELLTTAEYHRVENAYIASALSFCREAGVESLTVRGLENHGGVSPTISEGAVIPLEQVQPILTDVLREHYWCKLEGLDSFIHVGYDFYMYLGTPSECPTSIQLAGSLGLFVESFHSPYGDTDAA